jgi:phosphoribosylanthranilate isomerase
MGKPTESSNENWLPKVQVAGVSSLEESLFCADVGVDALGFTIGLPTGTHDGLTGAALGAFRPLIPGAMVIVLITYIISPRQLMKLVRIIAPHAVQFHGGIEPDHLKEFKEMAPGVKAIGRITVSGPAALERVEDFKEDLWDAVILDSHDPCTGRIGATGIIHDWSISAEIVRQCPLPVILAGGLNPKNVARAIEIVKPASVDAHTGLEKQDGSRDFSRIRNFALAAKRAFQRIG